jgi:hypothetical protein
MTLDGSMTPHARAPMQTYVRTLLTSLILFGLPGCFVFTERPKDFDPMLPDATQETGPSCTRDPLKGQVPCLPDANTSKADDSNFLTLAVREIVMDQSTKELPAGLDLDGIDSSPGGPNPGVGECTSVNGTDGPYGIDNNLGINLWGIIGNLLKLECEMERVHREGMGTLLIHITKWNAARDDAQLDVMMAPAVLGTHQPGWTSTANAQAAAATWTWGVSPTEIEYAEGWNEFVDLPWAEVSEGVRPPLPCWTEAQEHFDWFFANPNAFDGLGFPKVTTTKGYMYDGWFVMKLPDDASLDLMTDRRSVQVKLQDAYIVAQLEDDFTRTKHAYAAGRMTVKAIKEVSPAIGFCDTETLGATYEAFADLFADPTRKNDPNYPPETNCVVKDGETVIDSGAISVGVELQAVKVGYAGKAPIAASWPVPNACAEGSPPPPRYDCPNTGEPDFEQPWQFTPPAHCP